MSRSRNMTAMWIILVTLAASSLAHGLNSTETVSPEVNSSSTTHPEPNLLPTSASEDNSSVIPSIESDEKDDSDISSPKQSTAVHSNYPNFTTEDNSPNVTERSFSSSRPLSSSTEVVSTSTDKDLLPEDSDGIQSNIGNASERYNSVINESTTKPLVGNHLHKIAKMKLKLMKKKINVTYDEDVKMAVNNKTKHRLGSRKMHLKTEKIIPAEGGATNQTSVYPEDISDQSSIHSETNISRFNETSYMEVSTQAEDEHSATGTEADMEHKDIGFAANESLQTSTSDANKSMESSKNESTPPHKIRKRNLEDTTVHELYTESGANYTSTEEPVSTTVSSVSFESGRSTESALTTAEIADSATLHVNRNTTDSESKADIPDSTTGTGTSTPSELQTLRNVSLEISTSHTTDESTENAKVQPIDYQTEKSAVMADSPAEFHRSEVRQLKDSETVAGLNSKTPRIHMDEKMVANTSKEAKFSTLGSTDQLQSNEGSEGGDSAEFFSGVHTEVDVMPSLSTPLMDGTSDVPVRDQSDASHDKTDQKVSEFANNSLTLQKYSQLSVSPVDEDSDPAPPPHNESDADTQNKEIKLPVENVGNNSLTSGANENGEKLNQGGNRTEMDKFTTEVEFITMPVAPVDKYDINSNSYGDYYGESDHEFDADQSEVRPISIELSNEHQSGHNSNDSKVQGDRMTVLNNFTSETTSSSPPLHSVSLDEVITFGSILTEKGNATVIPDMEIEAKDNSSLHSSGRDDDQITLNQTKIAGVGVKTTVSVSMNVSKTNESIMNESVPVDPRTESIAGGNDVEIPETSFQPPKDTSEGNSTTTEYKNEEMPINTLKSVTLGTGPRETSTQEQPTTIVPDAETTRGNFIGLRKPRPRAPYVPPKQRTTTSGPPVMIFQKEKTRRNSITSSTTAIAIPAISSKPFTRRPWTIKPNFANVPSYNSGNGVIPIAPGEEEEEEEEEDEEDHSDDDSVTRSTTEQILPDDEVVVMKVESVIKVDQGLPWREQLNYRSSPVYRKQSRKMKEMLEVLFQGTSIAPRLWKIEIDGFRKERGSKGVGVDYFLYVVKSNEEIDKTILINTLNERLINSTFLRYTLDPASTEFKVLQEEKISKPTVAPENVEPPIPQWAIAVIVIGAASLIFIILFGAVTVYGRHHMRRRYNSKLNDEDMEKTFESREWESKMGAAYENLAADGIYDVDDGNPENMKKKYSSAGVNVRGPMRVSRHDSWKSDYWTGPPRRSRRSMDPTIF